MDLYDRVRLIGTSLSLAKNDPYIVLFAPPFLIISVDHFLLNQLSLLTLSTITLKAYQMLIYLPRDPLI